MRRNDDLGHFGTIRIIREELGLVKDFKEGQVISSLDDSSKGIYAVAHICVATDYIDGGEGGRIRIPKHGGEP